MAAGLNGIKQIVEQGLLIMLAKLIKFIQDYDNRQSRTALMTK